MNINEQGRCFVLMSTRRQHQTHQHSQLQLSPPPPHFTSLVINSLCQSSRVIGRTSSPVKRLISMLLCGWLKAMINNVMALLKICFPVVFHNQQCLVILIVFMVMYLSLYLTDLREDGYFYWFVQISLIEMEFLQISWNTVSFSNFQQSYFYLLD